MEFWINNQSVLYCIDLLNMSRDLRVQPVGAGTSLVFHAVPNPLTNIKKWSRITIVSAQERLYLCLEKRCGSTRLYICL